MLPGGQTLAADAAQAPEDLGDVVVCFTYAEYDRGFRGDLAKAVVRHLQQIERKLLELFPAADRLLYSKSVRCRMIHRTPG